MSKPNHTQELCQRLLRRYRQRLLTQRLARNAGAAAIIAFAITGLSGVFLALIGGDKLIIWLVMIFAFLGALAILFIVTHQATRHDAAIHADQAADGRGELPTCVEGKARTEQTWEAALATLQRALLGPHKGREAANWQRIALLPAIGFFVLGVVLPSDDASSKETQAPPESRQSARLDASPLTSALDALRADLLANSGEENSKADFLKQVSLNVQREHKEAQQKVAAARKLAASLKEELAKKTPEGRANASQLLSLAGVSDLPAGADQSRLEAAAQELTERLLAEAEAALLKSDQNLVLAARLSQAEVASHNRAKATGLGADGIVAAQDLELATPQPIRLSPEAWENMGRRRASSNSAHIRAARMMEVFHEEVATGR